MRKKYQPPTIEDYIKIKDINPMFWKTCDKCNDKIKNEPMWSLEFLGTIWKRGYYEYFGHFHLFLCKDCCPSSNDVKNYYIQNSKL